MENKTGNNIAYIDGANLHKGVESLGWKLDYDKFRIWLFQKYGIAIAKIFMGKVLSHKDIYARLRESGFEIIFKKAVRQRNRKIKANCDTELAVTALSDFYEKRLAKAIIVSSDGDFSIVGQFLKERYSILAIVSPRNSCSLLLKRLNLPILYLDSQRIHLEIVISVNEKALGGDETPQRSSSSDGQMITNSLS